MDVATVKKRLYALLCGVGIAAAAVAGTSLALPAQSARDAGKDYGYVYSGAKSGSVDFVRFNLQENSLLVLGSSEFSTPAVETPMPSTRSIWDAALLKAERMPSK